LKILDNFLSLKMRRVEISYFCNEQHAVLESILEKIARDEEKFYKNYFR